MSRGMRPQKARPYLFCPIHKIEIGDVKKTFKKGFTANLNLSNMGLVLKYRKYLGCSFLTEIRLYLISKRNLEPDFTALTHVFFSGTYFLLHLKYNTFSNEPFFLIRNFLLRACSKVLLHSMSEFQRAKFLPQSLCQ